MTLTPVSNDIYLERAHAAGIDLPLEQHPAWDAFDEAMAGRTPFGRAIYSEDGHDLAFISLTELEGRGFRYLWAKHGPVWVQEPSRDQEISLRRELARLAPKHIAFIRLHAEPSDDLHELLQSVTFDRTIVLDLTHSEDDLLTSMKKRGRRDVRKAGRNEDLVFANETDVADEIFGEAYELLKETGERDSFGIAPESTYRTMLSSLKGHARLYTVRMNGALACWGIVTTNTPLATYYYAASSADGRKAGAPDLLVWEMAKDLKKDGFTEFDLMGIDSERAPQLKGVTGFKTKFSEEITEVAGAWDYPTRPLFYKGLVKALALKHKIEGRLK